MHRYIVTGTGTDVGKTVFAAALAGFLSARYWKPVQAGTEDGTDSLRVAELSGGRATILPEGYVLRTPCSPHEAARMDGVKINPARLPLPADNGPLVVEGAGGALVPLSDGLLAADLFAIWGLPVIVVARTSLGTISYSLMTLEVLRARGLDVHGVIFMGAENIASERAITEMGKAQHLGRLPFLNPLTSQTLADAFEAHIRTDLL